MSHPVYVLLPDGVEWAGAPRTTSQAARPVSWYLRQLAPGAATQTAVLVDGDDAALPGTLADVARRATELGGIAVDATTQQPVDPAAPVVAP